MSIESLKEALPDYAKDLKLNLGNVTTTPGMSDLQIWGTALACALAARHAGTIRAIAAEAETRLSAQELFGAKAAAAMMGMNNVYYRAAHLLSAKDYATMPARLRMQVIGNPGVDKLDFELICLAVSAINGCGACLDSHEKVVIEKGATRELVQNALRIAATINAVAVTLEGEEAMERVAAMA